MIDSQYRKTDLVSYENISKLDFNKKFLPHVIKENVWKMSKGQELTIPFNPEILFWIDKDEHLSHFIDKEGESLTIRKDKDYDFGSMNEWSFVIITQGKRNEMLKRLVSSIQEQKIPNYEIIIVGGTPHSHYESWKVTYVPFNEKDELGWITKKKNLGCERARYENLCVLHDDCELDKDWFSKMKEWGNEWEFCNLSIFPEERSTLSWFRETGGKNFVVTPGDYHSDQYVGGHCIILKKFVWKKVLWNENLFYGQREDVLYSFSLRNNGFLLRISPAGIWLKG